jgi:hypothetical protein
MFFGSSWRFLSFSLNSEIDEQRATEPFSVYQPDTQRSWLFSFKIMVFSFTKMMLWE